MVLLLLCVAAWLGVSLVSVLVPRAGASVTVYGACLIIAAVGCGFAVVFDLRQVDDHLRLGLFEGRRVNEKHEHHRQNIDE